MDIGSMAGNLVKQLGGQMGVPEQLSSPLANIMQKTVGNQMSIAKSMFEMFNPLASPLASFMGQGFGMPAFIPRPSVNFPLNFGLTRNTYPDKEAISVIPQNGIAGLLGHKQVNIDGRNISLPPGFDTRGMTPESFEAALFAPGNDLLRQSVGAQLGGRIVYDKAFQNQPFDGNLTIAKPLPHPMLPYQNHVHKNVGEFLNRTILQPAMQQTIFNQLSDFLKNLKGAAEAVGQLGGQGQTQGTGQQGGTSGPGQASGGGGDIPAWDNSKSFEANITAILAATVESQEKKIKEKTGELQSLQQGGKEGAGQAEGGSQGGGGGFLGSILGGGGGGGGGFLGSILGGGGGGGLLGSILGGGGGGGFLGSILGGGGGGLLKMGAGILGGMYGGPMGSAAASSIAGAVAGGGGGGGAAGGPGGAGGTDKKDAQGKSESSIMQEIDALVKTLERMKAAMEKILNASHDMALKAVSR